MAPGTTRGASRRGSRATRPRRRTSGAAAPSDALGGRVQVDADTLQTNHRRGRNDETPNVAFHATLDGQDAKKCDVDDRFAAILAA